MSTQPPSESGHDPGDDRPEFGPGGYLPGKAAKRARKIVLRAELGIQWVIASVVAAALLLVAGLLWWNAREVIPVGYTAVVETRAVSSPGDSRAAFDVFVLNADGRLRVFDHVDPSLTYCEATGQLEARLDEDVAVWSLTGRSLDGGPGLPQHPFVVEKGAVWVDRDRQLPVPAGRDEGVEPTCLR